MTKEIEIEGFGAFADAIEGIYNRPAIPETTGATAGDVLTLGSDGPEWAEVPKELPDATGTSTGDVLSIGASGPEWATPAGGGGGAFIDTANVIQGNTSILEYSSLNYTATHDCCVVFEFYPKPGELNSISIDSVVVKSFFGTLGVSAGYAFKDNVYLKAGQSLVVQYNGQNYLGNYTVYGVK